ncbi:hypothetical protein EON65_53865 [archaeon]|nr:MAG: hypothetical protein EON65_53865 [archaeon]
MVKLFFWRKSKDKEEKERSRSVSPSKKKDSRISRFFGEFLGKKQKSNNTMETVEISLTTDNAAAKGDISPPYVSVHGGILIFYMHIYKWCVC